MAAVRCSYVVPSEVIALPEVPAPPLEREQGLDYPESLLSTPAGVAQFAWEAAMVYNDLLREGGDVRAQVRVEDLTGEMLDVGAGRRFLLMSLVPRE